MNLQDKTDDELNRMVAEAQGWIIISDAAGNAIWGTHQARSGAIVRVDMYAPCTNWKQAGELVEKFDIDLHAYVKEGRARSWYANNFNSNNTQMRWSKHHANADTPQRAIVMAAIAALSKEKQ
jgi:hypothetical protein